MIPGDDKVRSGTKDFGIKHLQRYFAKGLYFCWWLMVKDGRLVCLNPSNLVSVAECSNEILGT